jgi:arylsulfatase A-like enzyme
MNLLVLCADTFRADYLGCYGDTWVETPYLDKLATEGVRFSDFYGEGLPTLRAARVLHGTVRFSVRISSSEKRPSASARLASIVRRGHYACRVAQRARLRDRTHQRRLPYDEAGEEFSPRLSVGESFWPLVTGERSGGLRDVVIFAFGLYASVRTEEWNYHTAWAKPQRGQVRPPELYDRRSDPEELVNVIDQHPDVARELQALLDRVLKDHGATASTMGETETPAAVPGVKW